MSAQPTVRRVRRSDPGRREHIIDACLDVIATDGVAGTSHRRVAARANVPLGSMTYHFSGMDELLTEAFSRFADRVAAQYERRMAVAATPEEAQAVIVSIIEAGPMDNQPDVVIAHELYTLAARQPSYRPITEKWMSRSREVLAQHFDAPTTHILDALIEGLTIHGALSTEPVDAALITEAVRRVVAQ